MPERTVRIPLPSGKLTLFDPAVLAHRRSVDPGWASDPNALSEEVNALRLAAITAGEGTVEVLVPDGDAAAPPASAQSAGVRVQSGKLFLGDATELPSRAWGKRRWNLWDWSFAGFVLVLIPFTVWLAGFDSRTLWYLGGTTIFFLFLCIPITWAMFRNGHDFKRRSGVPPKDHPDRVLDLPPGDYVVAWERRTVGEVPVVQLWFGLRAGTGEAAGSRS